LRHIPALGAPDGAKNFKLRIGRYGAPDISGPGAKGILRFKKRLPVAIFAANKTFTYFAVKKMGPNNQPFTGTIGIHYRGRCHLHIPYGVASRAEFPFHAIHQVGLIRPRWINPPEVYPPLAGG
jgi:hypothetical protein